jgi:plastocyanin
MKITILATKSCNHRPILEQQLQDAGLQSKLEYFEDFTGEYVYHCHNLEHEDMGMMRNYEVISS